jgi:predicted ATP-grasp superfamily ATP-dependent carboligase
MKASRAAIQQINTIAELTAKVDQLLESNKRIEAQLKRMEKSNKPGNKGEDKTSPVDPASD